MMAKKKKNGFKKAQKTLRKYGGIFGGALHAVDTEFVKIAKREQATRAQRKRYRRGLAEYFEKGGVI